MWRYDPFARARALVLAHFSAHRGSYFCKIYDYGIGDEWGIFEKWRYCENSVDIKTSEFDRFVTALDSLNIKKINHYSFRNYTEDEQHSAPSKTVDKRLAKYLDAKKEFEVILLGLDGGVKLERDEEIPLAELFRVIDAMPMRASEMRNKKG